ncbi:MAG: hypothetical protein K6G30_14725 [Acetatifactor sp.]|nr:hypothetical protein [Acetatifactor sp.]
MIEFMWTLAACGLADGIGRIILQRQKKEQFKAVDTLKRRALWMSLFVTSFLGIILCVCADFIVKDIFISPFSKYSMLLLIPSLVFRVIAANLEGWLRGDGLLLPACLSRLLREFFLLGFLFLFSGIFRQYGIKVAALLEVREFESMYVAMGFAVAVDIVDFLSCIFLIFIYAGNKKNKKNIESMKQIDCLSESVGIILSARQYDFVRGILFIIPFLGGTVISLKKTGAASELGLLLMSLVPFCFVVMPILFAEIFPSALRMVGMSKRQDYRGIKNVFQNGVHISFIVGTFWMVYLAGMARPIVELLSLENEKNGILVLQYGAFFVPAILLSFYLASILWYMNKKLIVFAVWFAADLLFLILSIFMLHVGTEPVLGLVYSMAASVIAACGCLVFFACRKMNCSIRWIETFCIPVIAAVITFLIGLLVQKFLFIYLGNVTTLLVGMLLLSFIYWILLLLTRSVRENEMKGLFFGKILTVLGHLLGAF